MKTTDSVRDLARGLIAWYNFKKNGKKTIELDKALRIANLLGLDVELNERG